MTSQDPGDAGSPVALRGPEGTGTGAAERASAADRRRAT
jgi:hypothetical protein